MLIVASRASEPSVGRSAAPRTSGDNEPMWLASPRPFGEAVASAVNSRDRSSITGPLPDPLEPRRAGDHVSVGRLRALEFRPLHHEELQPLRTLALRHSLSTTGQ